MKILIYGDSNVCDGKEGWPVILQNMLGDGYEIVWDGLVGRVAGSLEKIEPNKNGKDTFMEIFKTWAPLDLIIIMLGTNDLQNCYKRKSQEILEDLKWYKEVIEDFYIDLDNRRKYFNERLPKFLFITPVKFDYKNGAKDLFNYNSFKEYMDLRSLMKKSFGDVVDANGLSLDKDGVHLNKEGQLLLAELVFRKIIG